MPSANLACFLAPQNNNFNAVRLGAALAVVASHVFLLATGVRANEPLLGVTHFTLGQHAVNVFFMLSGLVIAASLHRASSYKDFAQRRLLRVCPGLAASVLIVSLLLGPLVSNLPAVAYLTDPEIGIFVAKMVALSTNGTTLPGVFATNPIQEVVNEPLWTIKYELLCYAALVAFSALGLVRTPNRCLGLLLGSVASYAVLRWLDQLDGQISSASHIARFWLCFALGVTAYNFRDAIRPSWPVAAGLAGAFWMSIGTCLELVLSYLAIGYGVLCLSVCPAGRLRRLTNATDLSYGVYIYGWPITQTIVWAYPGLSPWGVLALAVPLSLAAAWLSWQLVERPALSRKGRPAVRRFTAALNLNRTRTLQEHTPGA